MMAALRQICVRVVRLFPARDERHRYAGVSQLQRSRGPSDPGADDEDIAVQQVIRQWRCLNCDLRD